MTPAQRKGLRDVEKRLRAAALGYPESYEDFPWGDRVVKVRGKIFLFMGLGDQSFGLSVKLPQSSDRALALPFTTPTGYGLGRSGWVSARFTSARQVPADLVRDWIDESYRAVAPRRVVAQLPARSGAGR